MPEIHQLADALCAALAAFEPGRYSAEDCADLAEQLARTGRTCETASARAAARAAQSGAHRDRGIASAPEWLARAAGSTTGRARSALETLEAVEACPDAKDALLAGALSLEQASEIARLPQHATELLEIAKHQSLRALKDHARKLRLESIDPEELHSRQRERREVRHWVDDELGLVRLVGAFSPEFGKRFAHRLDRETDRVWRDARRERRNVTRAQCAADAFERLFSGTSTARTGTTDLMFVCDLNAWARGHAHAGEVAHIVGGGPVPMSVVREHAVDAFVKVAFHDGTKVDTIVHYGRRRPALLQSVLDLGDPPEFDGVVCSEEGCDRRFGLQWDHKDPCANGGSTRKRNLQALCDPHHFDKTERDRAAGLLRGSGKERGPP